MQIKDLRTIAYTFAKYSHQFDVNKPYYASRARIYSNEDNCEKAMKLLVDHDYNKIKKAAEEQDWAHKYIDIDECSDESDYEIRGYDTEDHDHDYVVLYRYASYPIYQSQIAIDTFIYRGFVISAILDIRDGRFKTKFSVINTIDSVDFDVYDSVEESIDAINNFLAYMDMIGNDLFEEEEKK